jgi:septal ring factor EnvC (AmiA/AmiB activator)
MAYISRKKTALLILCLSLYPELGHCGVPNYTEKASDIRAELSRKKAEHDALLKKSRTLSSEVSDLKKDLIRLSKDLRESEEKLSGTDDSLNGLRQKKAQIVEALYKDQQAMGGLVSAVRKYSRTSTPDMLMQSDPIDAARASIVMKSVMPRLQEQSMALQEKLDEISSIEEKISGQLAIQKQEANKINKQQGSLAVLLQKRQELYQSTESQRLAQEKEVARLTRESKNIEDLIQNLKPKTKTAKRGGKNADDAPGPLPAGMALPVHGKVYTAFGQKDDLGAPSKGITFSTRTGASVITPLGGIVKFAGPFQKYKQILIVEHKDGYHSLIAGLARIDTVVGASLAAGEPVGVAEASDAPKVYYELRRNGKPINPQRSLLAQRKQVKG